MISSAMRTCACTTISSSTWHRCSALNALCTRPKRPRTGHVRCLSHPVASALTSHASDTPFLEKLVEKYAAHGAPAAGGTELTYVFVKPPTSAQSETASSGTSTPHPPSGGVPSTPEPEAAAAP